MPSPGTEPKARTARPHAICGQSGTTRGFLWILPFPLPIVPPNVLCCSVILPSKFSGPDVGTVVRAPNPRTADGSLTTRPPCAGVQPPIDNQYALLHRCTVAPLHRARPQDVHIQRTCVPRDRVWEWWGVFSVMTPCRLVGGRLRAEQPFWIGLVLVLVRLASSSRQRRKRRVRSAQRQVRLVASKQPLCLA
jgi:hypothetical protein